jgi:hypothetical protein
MMALFNWMQILGLVAFAANFIFIDQGCAASVAVGFLCAWVPLNTGHIIQRQMDRK